MNVSLNWLNDHIDLTGYGIAELSDLLTFAGVEVENIEQRGLDVDLVVVARVESSEKHPDADKLSVCKVDDGSGTLRQIVCGARNYGVGDKVPLALPGAVLPGGFKIKKGKLRGVESLGMLCSGRELGLSQDHEGLMILGADAPVGAPLRELVPSDTVIEVEVTPNRSDWLSHLGIARELAALTGQPLKRDGDCRATSVPVRKAEAAEVAIDAPAACPFYTARVIRGVTVAPSPEWLQQKLQSIGLRPINNIVDITNFVLMEMGQPLHAFDVKKLDGGIRVRHAREGEAFLALDGETYILQPQDLVIADQSRAVAIGGVMGGEDSGVTATTTDVLLESAYFDPQSIRRTSRRLGLSSDSSYRFERGIDPQQTVGASELAARMILEIAGGSADECVLCCGAPPVLAGEVTLDIQGAVRLLGADIPEVAIDRILTGLGLVKAGGTGGVCSQWTIPSYRLDLRRHIDLVEEIARVHGIDNIPATRGALFADASAADHAYDFLAKTKTRLVALGFHEANTIKLVADSQLDGVLGTAAAAPRPVPLKNPLSDDHTTLRPSIVPALLAVAERNVRMGASSLRLFETGTIFSRDGGDTARENQAIALLMSGPSQPESWHSNQAAALDFYDLRAVLESLVPAGLRLQSAAHPALLLPAQVYSGDVLLGWAGQLPPALARRHDIGGALLVAELDLALLQAHGARGDVRFSELARFPGSARDIAMFVPVDLPNGSIEAFFASLTEPLLESFRVFDVFMPEPNDAGGRKRDVQERKSIAYSLTYRDEGRTLQSIEVDEVHGRVLEALKQALPVEVR